MACAGLYGHAYECVQKCEALILKRKRLPGPELQQLLQCPVKWRYDCAEDGVRVDLRYFCRRVVRSNICWPDDCNPVMRYFCGEFVGMAVKGWDIRYGPTVRDHSLLLLKVKFGGVSVQHPAYFDLCAVCVEHYVFIRTPPVQVGAVLR